MLNAIEMCETRHKLSQYYQRIKKSTVDKIECADFLPGTKRTNICKNINIKKIIITGWRLSFVDFMRKDLGMF